MNTTCSSILLLLFIQTSGFAQMHQAAKPTVLILTTGGTIATPADAPRIDGPTLVKAVPELSEHAQIEVEEFSLIGSSKMTPAHWLALAKRINTLFTERSKLSGIVVTHGTDTMEETAFFLNLTVKFARPVVVTGSMRSPGEISADGPANLVNAVRVAAAEDAAGHGVLVVLNEDISSAREVRKTHNRRVHTFRSSSAGYLGTADPDAVHFFQRALRPHTAHSEFDVSGLDELPTVLILSDFTGIDAALVSEFGRQEMDGLVVRTFAGGRMSQGMLDGLQSLKGRGIPTVVTSRVPDGRIVDPPDYEFPAVVAHDLADNKARILLILALTKTRDLAELQLLFSTY